MANFKTEEVNTDLLIVGGGMAACGAAVGSCILGKETRTKSYIG